MVSRRRAMGLATGAAVLVALSGAFMYHHAALALAQERSGVPVLWMYGDANGETHLKDIKIDVSPLIGLRGAKRETPGTDAASEVIESAGVQFRMAGKAQDHGPRQGDWHEAKEVPGQFIILLKGQFEVATTDGQKRVLGPGDVLLEDDSYSKGHYSRAITPDRMQVFIPLKTAFKRPF